VVWLAVALTALFCLMGAAPLPWALFSVWTAALACAVIAQAGVGCSLAARTPVGALVPTLLFALAITAGTVGLVGLCEEYHGPVLWVLSPAVWGVGRLWVRRWPGPAAVGCYLLGLHLSLASLAVCWTWRGFYPEDEWPAAAMNPAYLVVALLAKRPWEMFLNDADLALGVVLAYGAALVVNLVWARRWLARNFDPLAGRAGWQKRPPVPPDRAAARATG
jgi:hypothetical protein